MSNSYSQALVSSHRRSAHRSVPLRQVAMLLYRKRCGIPNSNQLVAWIMMHDDGATPTLTSIFRNRCGDSHQVAWMTEQPPETPRLKRRSENPACSRLSTAVLHAPHRVYGDVLTSQRRPNLPGHRSRNDGFTHPCWIMAEDMFIHGMPRRAGLFFFEITLLVTLLDGIVLGNSCIHGKQDRLTCFGFCRCS